MSSKRRLFVTLALLHACGSNGNGHDPAPPPPPSTTEANSHMERAETSEDTEDTEDIEVTQSTLPSFVEAPMLLVEIDKFGVRVSGGSWFKAQAQAIRREHAQEFKTQIVSAFRPLSPLKATMRTVGRSLFYPAIVGLKELLQKRAAIVGDDSPVPVELQVKRGVPFWLVTHFANFLLWNDGVAHLQIRGGKKLPGLVIARGAATVRGQEPSCAQGHVLLRRNQALVFWEAGFNEGLSSPQDVTRPEWAGPPKACGPWTKIDKQLFSQPIPEATGLSPCQSWRVDALGNETNWDDVAPLIARNLPEENVLLLGNVSHPSECRDD